MFRDNKKIKPFSIDVTKGFFDLPGIGGGGDGGGDDGKRRKQSAKNVDILEASIQKLMSTMAAENALISKSRGEHKKLREEVGDLLEKKAKQNGIDKLIIQSHTKLTAALKKETDQRKKLEAQLKKRAESKALKEEQFLLKLKLTSLANEKKEIQKANAIRKKETESRRRNAQKIKELNDKLKQYGGTIKQVAGSSRVLKKVIEGDAVALRKLTARVKEATTANSKLNKQFGFYIRNTRNSTSSLSVLRSQILITNFALAMTAGKMLNLVKIYGVQERAETAFAQALKSTGSSAGQTSRSISLLASEIQKMTGVGDEAVIQSAALLKTFVNIGSQVFPQAQKAIVDVAAGMFQGNVTMEALKTTTIQVGKALNDPIKGMTALSRVGVQFSGEQKLQIKRFIFTNQLAKAQGIILGELEKQFGGLGDEIGKTTEGKLLALNSAFGDAQERIGKFLTPAVNALIESLTKFSEALQPSNIIQFGVALTTSIIGVKLYNSGITFAQIKTKLFTKAVLANIATLKIWQSSTGIGAIITATTLAGTALLNLLNVFTDVDQATGISANALDELRTKWNKLNNSFAQEKETEKLRERFNAVSNAIIEEEDKIQSLKFKFAEFSIEQNKLNSLQLEAKRLKASELQSSEKELERKNKEIETQKEIVKQEDIARNQIKAKINQREEMIEMLEAELDKTQKRIDLSEELVVTKQKEEAAFKAQQIVDATEKYNNQALAQKQLNDLNNEGLNVLFGYSKRQEMLTKEAAKYGLSVEQLLIHQPELTESIGEYASTLEEAARRTQVLSEANKLKQQTMTFLTGMYDQELQKLDEIMEKDIENAKKSSAFKIAQKIGDERLMKKIEDDARKKTLPDRIKAFKQKQNVTIAGIAIDTAGAIIKAFKDFGYPGGLLPAALITASAAMQTKTVMQQKPPAFALGGDFVTTGPQMIMVGDNPGGRERVQVTPLSSPNVAGPQGGSVNITFTGNVLSQDFIENQAIPQIKEAVRRGADLGVS